MDYIKKFKGADFLKVAVVVVGLYFLYTYAMKEKLENVDTQQPEVPAEEPEVEAVIAPKDQLSAEDLLPKYDEANEFAEQNPVSKLLQEQNFLISGYHSGINTVLQSNKIPYHDIRSAPPIPKESVGPWSQSSYEQPAGANRRKLEIN
jgi:hypothetical protein